MTTELERSSKYHCGSVHQVVVWDLLVRTGHWLLVVFFFVAYFTEDDLLTIHSWAGYGVSAYIIVRVLWGFVGPRYARFTDFAYGPRTAALYLRDLIFFKAKRYLGHSPAGGLMVLVLLLSLAATTVSGMALLAVEEDAGPFAPWLAYKSDLPETRVAFDLIATPAAADGDESRDGDDGRRNEKKSEFLEEAHEFFSNLTLLLVIMHIAGVAWASIVHKENLARAMVTGRKRSEEPSRR